MQTVQRIYILTLGVKGFYYLIKLYVVEVG